MSHIYNLFICLALFTSGAQASSIAERTAQEAVENFQPENALEFAVTASSEWREGVMWGESRVVVTRKVRLYFM